MGFGRLIGGVMVVLAAAGGVSGADMEVVGVCFFGEGRLVTVEREVAAGESLVEGALEALVLGPVDGEIGAGYYSYIGRGTRVVSVAVEGEGVVVDFSMELLAEELTEERLAGIYEQVAGTLGQFGLAGDVRMTVEGVGLVEFVEAVAEVAERGAAGRPMEAGAGRLAGRSMTLSPGHGWYWTGSGWASQRPVYCAPLNREDHHNLEMCRYLEKYLEAEGMVVRTVRETDLEYGNHYSGRPWWRMASYLWLQREGYPCSVYASSTGSCTTGAGGSERNDDIRARPLASDYDGTDIYVSLHTNGFAGDCTGSCPTGTETYYDASSEHAAWGEISRELATQINTNIVDVLVEQVDSTWRCHGTCVKNSNGAYGEIRIPNRAAALVELGYHDTCDRDADSEHLGSNYFRSAAMWGMYKGICGYFGVSPTWGFYSCEHVGDTLPETLRAGQAYTATVTMRNRGVVWQAERNLRLGAVGWSDPFSSEIQVRFEGEVEPGEAVTFTIEMAAPAAAGEYVMQWRMVRNGPVFFGPAVSKAVRVLHRGDLDGDGDVDLWDMSILGRHWLESDCGAGGCEGADLDGAGSVDVGDLRLMLEDWLG